MEKVSLKKKKICATTTTTTKYFHFFNIRIGKSTKRSKRSSQRSAKNHSFFRAPVIRYAYENELEMVDSPQSTFQSLSPFNNLGQSRAMSFNAISS
jgi:hypothetical protein